MTAKAETKAFHYRFLCVTLAFILAVTLGLFLPPAGDAKAEVVDPPRENIPEGWPWKINNICYPTLGYPQIIKRGQSFTLEFDCNGRASGTTQPDVADWDVRLLSSNDPVPEVLDLPVQSAARAESVRWPKGNKPESATNGEWSGPWAGRQVWHVKVAVPSDVLTDLYDLEVKAEGVETGDGVEIMTDTQPHAVQVVEFYKEDYNFIQISDFHINDPRGPSDSFIPGPYPDPKEFKNYQYNSKAIEDVNLINPDFVIMTGDLPFGYPMWAHMHCPKLDPSDDITDYTGKKPHWNGEYNKAYEQLLNLTVPVVCIPGNHDCYNLETQFGYSLWYSKGGKQDGAHIWPTMIGPRFFSWDYGKRLHLTCINSYDKIQRDTDPLVLQQRSFIPVAQTPPADGGNGWVRDNQKAWMIADLAAAQGKYDLSMTATHAPFYGKSSWDTWATQAIMDELMGYMRTYDVGLVISGHTHRDDVHVDQTNPGAPVTYLNTTTTSFGTIEYPGFRRVFINDGGIGNYNYKPDIYSYPTYKDTQIVKHSSAKEAEKALRHLDTPSVEGEFSSTDPLSTDKTFKCTNYFTQGDPQVVLDNTVVDFVMGNVKNVDIYQVTGGTLLDYWRPSSRNMTLRVKTDDIAPRQTVNTRVRALCISLVSPNSGRQGGTLDVTIQGFGTDFKQGESRATFSGDGIDVQSTTVISPRQAKARISIEPGATLGARDVNVVTGSEVPTPLYQGFTVEGESAMIRKCSPANVVAGHVVDLHVLGGETHFQDGLSQATVSGDGITVDSTTVSDATHATARITVSDGATPGKRSLNVVTGAENPYPLINGLVVHAAPQNPPFIRETDPASGPVGTEVEIEGGNFGNCQGSSQVTFNGVPATEYAHWSDGDITCVVPFGARSGPIRVVTPWGTSEGHEFEVAQFTFYFAEGTTRSGFNPYLCIQNPGDDKARVTISYMTGDGQTIQRDLEVEKTSRSTVNVIDVLGTGDDPAHDFSSKVECTNDQEIVVERPMYFDYHGAWTGGSDVVGLTAPQSAFYFAEGSCRPGFEPYICVQNPNATAASVTITYMTGDGSNREQHISVPAGSRSTVNVIDTLGSADDVAHDFSSRVECTNGKKIIAERPMYFDYHGEWTGGHDVMGDPSPGTTYYFAEGSCRTGFEPYFCIQNPGAQDATVQITYMKGDCTTHLQNLIVGARSRSTVNVIDELGTGDDAAHDFSARVECTNYQDIVVERPMYFDYGADQGLSWTGGSDVIGAPNPSPEFYFAEGTTRPNFDSYICIQNPELARAEVLITYMKGDGTTQQQAVSVDPQSRSTVKVSDVIGVGNDPSHDFSAVVESTNGVDIVVERPMYFNYQGAWTGGHDVIGF